MHRLVMVFGLLLAGCSTDYRDLDGSGFVDGAATEKVANHTYRISAPGHSFASQAELHDYMMLKAAHTARRVGGTHFTVAMWGGEGASRSGSPLGGQASADTYIRVFALAPDQTPPSGAVSVASVLNRLG